MRHLRHLVAVAGLLVASAAMGTTIGAQATDHCPDGGTKTEVGNTYGPTVTLEPGTMFCVKAGTFASGILEMGESGTWTTPTTWHPNGTAPIDISYYVVYPPPPPPTVTPLAPTYLEATECEVEDTVTIPTVAGVVYRIGDVTTTGTFPLGEDEVVTVTAHALDGYQLADGTWTWTFTGSEVQPCPLPEILPPPGGPETPVVPTTPVVPVTPVVPATPEAEVLPSAPTPAPTQLPHTGVATLAMSLLATALVGAGAGLRRLGKER